MIPFMGNDCNLQLLLLSNCRKERKRKLVILQLPIQHWFMIKFLVLVFVKGKSQVSGNFTLTNERLIERLTFTLSLYLLFSAFAFSLLPFSFLHKHLIHELAYVFYFY